MKKDKFECIPQSYTDNIEREWNPPTTLIKGQDHSLYIFKSLLPLYDCFVYIDLQKYSSKSAVGMFLETTYIVLDSSVYC